MAEVNLELLQGLMLPVLGEQTETRRETTEARQDLVEARREVTEMRREQATVRRENGEMRTLLLLLSDQGRRAERKLGEIRDEIELMVKSELMGRLGHFETQIEARLDALAPQGP